MIVLPLVLLALPLAWMAALGPRDDVDNPTGAYPRLLLPALAVVGSLQIYPVAGTQVSLAAMLLLPVGAICISDGVRQLRLGSAALASIGKVADWLTPGVFLASAAALVLFAVTTLSEFSSLTPLALPAAESLRVPAQKGAELRALVAAIDQDCTSFITFPGMNSFYFWTGQIPPADVSSEVWWLVLDNSEQQTLVDHLQDKPRLCVVKNQQVIDFWAEGRQVPSRPLVEYIDANFVDSGSYGDYVLLVRRSS